MNRYLLIGTLTAALVLFAWQTLSNTALGWHEATLSRFDEPAIAAVAIESVAPERGMYFHERGILAAVSIDPAVGDRTSLMGMMMLRQLALNVLAAFLLALVVARLRTTPLRAAARLGTVALAAAIVLEMANWNWYGFPLAYSVVNVVDTALNVGIASLVLASFAARWLAPDEAAPASPPLEVRHAGA